MPRCSTFPGQAGEEGFALSNHYDAVLDREQREAALGWSVVALTDAAGRPEVTLTDRNGAPLNGASVAASAERPLGAPEQRALAFQRSDARALRGECRTAGVRAVGADAVGIVRGPRHCSDAAGDRALNIFHFSPPPRGFGGGGDANLALPRTSAGRGSGYLVRLSRPASVQPACTATCPSPRPALLLPRLCRGLRNHPEASASAATTPADARSDGRAPLRPEPAERWDLSRFIATQLGRHPRTHPRRRRSAMRRLRLADRVGARQPARTCWQAAST